MSRTGINGVAPFFIVRNAEDAVAFYRDKLGFDVLYQGPEGDAFFGMVGRDGAMLMIKAVGVSPEPIQRAMPMLGGMRTSAWPILMCWRRSSRRVGLCFPCR